MNKCILFIVLSFINIFSIMSQKVIDLSKQLEREEANLSRYASSMQTIALETSDSCLLSSALQIWYAPDYFFINDLQSKKVYRFDATNGKFLNTIGKLGQGPGEYGRIMNIYVDNATKKVYLMDSMKKSILIYTYNGTFLKSFTTNFVSYNMARLDNYLIFSDAYYDQTHKELYLTSLNGKIECYSKFTNKAKTGWMLETPFFFEHHGHCAYKHVVSNVVYEIDSKLQKRPIYQFDYGRYKIEEEEAAYSLEKGGYTKERENKIMIQSIRTCTHYLFITYTYKNKNYTVIYDEHTGKVSNPGNSTIAGLRDDLWGGPIVNLNSTQCPSYNSTDARKIISVIYCSELGDEECEYFNKTLGKVNSDSNPIIRIVTLK